VQNHTSTTMHDPSWQVVVTSCAAVIEAEQRRLLCPATLAAPDQHLCSLSLDVLTELMLRIQAFLRNYEPVSSAYASVFLNRLARRLGSIQHVHSYIQQHTDDFVRCAAQIAHKIAEENKQTTSAAHPLAHVDSTASDLAELRGLLGKLLDLLTGDERYTLMVNIQVDFPAGEKPVALGGTFEPDTAIFQHAKKFNAKSKQEHRERCRAAQTAARPFSKTPSTRLCRAVFKK